MIDQVKLVGLVGGADSAREASGLSEGPAVQRRQLARGEGVGGRIEIVQIREQITRGIADLPVALRAAREDLLGDGAVVPVIERADPETENVRAVAGDQLLRLDHVADGLRELAPRNVLEETVRDDLTIGRMPEEGDRGQQRRLEPAAMLVVPLQIEIRGRFTRA